MPRSDADVIVIGVGTMGSAALWRLAARGVRVIGIEQYEPGHDRGSGHGESRIIRTAYHEHPSYVSLVRSAWRLWRSLEASTGTALLTRTGLVVIGPAAGALISGAMAAVRAHDLRHEIFDEGTLGARYPQHVLGPGDIAVVEPDAGFLRPELAIKTMVSAARAAGADLLTGARVVGIDPGGGRVAVRLESDAVTAERVIVCAGAWVGEVVPPMATVLQVERQVPMWFPVDSAQAFGATRFPVFIRELDGRHLYGAPTLDGATVKIGLHHGGSVTTPDSLDRSLRDDDIAILGPLVRRSLRGVNERPVRAAVCMYTNAPDGHFIVGPLPGQSRVTVVSACSGHGFKFAPIIGEIAADVTLDGGTVEEHLRSKGLSEGALHSPGRIVDAAPRS